MIDCIANRRDLKNKVAEILAYLCKSPGSLENSSETPPIKQHIKK